MTFQEQRTNIVYTRTKTIDLFTNDRKDKFGHSYS